MRKKCVICNVEDAADHKRSSLHDFNFKLWAFRKYKKVLVLDKHDVKITVTPSLSKKTFTFNDDIRSGKYKIELPLANMPKSNQFSYIFTIENQGSNGLLLISADILEASLFFQIEDKDGFRAAQAIPCLEAGAKYNVHVSFSLASVMPGSFQNHFCFNFKREDDINDFTICRSLVVDISEFNIEEPEEEHIIVGTAWTNVEYYYEPTQRHRYLDHYPIPSQYLTLLKNNPNSSSKFNENCFLKIRNEIDTHCKEQQKKYQNLWHLLLWVEEMAQMKMMESYNMAKVTVVLKNSNVIVLTVPGLEERKPSVVPGDIIKFRLHDDHTGYKGIVKRTNGLKVEIHYVHDELLSILEQFPNEELDVSFSLSRLSFERMHEGIDRVAAMKLVPILFPENDKKPFTLIHNLQFSDFYNPYIINNAEQRKAVIKILNNQQKYPYIVFGPPGTGKTMTIVEAILQIKKRTNKKILVCAPANNACDLIAEKLLGFCNKTEMIRIHSATRDTDNLTPELLVYSNVDGDGVFKKVSLNSYRIVITTLTLIGRYSQKYNPDCIFIDEAAQASEPECSIAIGLLTVGKQLVLAGDPHQLGPIVCTEGIIKQYLGTTLLQRLMNYQIYISDDNFITKLKLNFRSHPQILAIPNEFFYRNDLEAKSTLWRKDPIVNIAIYPLAYRQKQSQKQAGSAIEFCGVIAKEKDKSSPSYFNAAEIDTVCKYIKTLMSLQLKAEYKVQQSDIGVVTPYARQSYKLKFRLKSMGYDKIEVGTTEKFQGREKRIIIISTVRAQSNYLLFDKRYNLGFVRNEKRFNVAITRAKNKLIIIGCPQVLLTCDKWFKLMKLCESANSYFGVKYQIRTEDLKRGMSQRMGQYF